MKKYLISLFIGFIILISPVFGQDQIVNGRNINVQITNPQGQGGGAGAVPWNSINTAYVLSPLGPDYGFCMSIVNDNPTSSHTLTVNAFQTGDAGVLDYSHNTGRYASLSIVGNPSPIPASTTNTFFVRSNGAAKIAFVFSGSTTQAGSPDTVDIYAVQTTAAGCGTVNPQTGQSYSLATPNTGTSAASPMSAISDGISQAYYAVSSQINPGANSVVLHINANNGIRTIYYYKVIVECSAACTIQLKNTNGFGSGCSSPGTSNPVVMKLQSTNTSTSLSNQSPCTTVPASQNFMQSDLAANTPIDFDVTGFIAPAGTGNGLEVFMITALTGTVNTTIRWYEK
jgi:hypothetical protein